MKYIVIPKGKVLLSNINGFKWVGPQKIEILRGRLKARETYTDGTAVVYEDSEDSKPEPKPEPKEEVEVDVKLLIDPEEFFEDEINED